MIDENDEAALKAIGKDEQTRWYFQTLIEAWTAVIKLRDIYPDVFDFRFLCHGATLPEDKIRELTDP